MAKILGVLVVVLVAWGCATQTNVQQEEEARWQQLDNNPSCAVWNAYPEPNDSVTWSGACVDGKAQGIGIEVWRFLEDGEWQESKYSGEMKGGKAHGRGVDEWADGGRFEGEYKDGEWHGPGVYMDANGDECAGVWRDGKLLGGGKGKANGQTKECDTDGETITFVD